MNRIHRLIATGLYSGYFPIAPGTVGSFLALVFFCLIPDFRGFILLTGIILLFFIGVWAASQTEKTDGHDASIINVDEIVGMWISVLFISSGVAWYWWIGGFFIFRIFDIIKPFPINSSQKLPGGWGVMIDDVIAGVYTNCILRIGLLFIR